MKNDKNSRDLSGRLYNDGTFHRRVRIRICQGQGEEVDAAGEKASEQKEIGVFKSQSNID